MTIRDCMEEFLRTRANRNVFRENEVKELLRASGMAVPKGMFIPCGKEFRSAVGLSFPLAAKVVSSRIASKSDVNGVRLGIGNEDELRKAVPELMRIEDAEGVLVEEMAKPGFEVIVSGIIDKTFGPIVMFGTGGFFVELFRDVSFALAPVDREQAMWLMSETKGEKMLKGFRGRPPLDMHTLADIIVNVSEIIANGCIQTVELNPVVLYTSGALVLDAKMRRL